MDMGSNSLRLVIYDGSDHGYQALYNHKLSCKFAQDVSATGAVGPAALKRASAMMVKFRLLLDNFPVQRLDILATAATRDASNQSEIVAMTEEIMQAKVRILSGEEEAFYSAHSVLSINPKANGLIADLGGGSLEIARLEHGTVTHTASAPLGYLMLLGKSDPRSALKSYIDSLDWVDEHENAYLIGGTWRSIGQLMAKHSGYPFVLNRSLRLNTKALLPFLERIIDGDPQIEDTLTTSQAKRWDVLPTAAIAAQELLAHVDAEKAIVLRRGLREGWVYHSRLEA